MNKFVINLKIGVLLLMLASVHQSVVAQYHFVNIILETTSQTEYPVTKPIYVCGNDILLGNWNPKSALMRPVNDSTRLASFMLQKEMSIEFCFTDGNHGLISSDSSVVLCPLLHQVQNDTTLRYRIRELKFSNVPFSPPNIKQ